MRNYIYARMSSNDRKKLQKQIDKVVDYCEWNGIKVDEIYRECFSGRDAYDFKNEERKELNALLKVIDNGDLIVCQSVSRLSRRGCEFVKRALDIIRGKGANIYFIIEALYSGNENDIGMILIKANEAKEHNYMFSELQKERHRIKKLNEIKQEKLRGKKKNNELVAIAIEDYINGCGNRTKTAICDKYNMSRATFDKYLREYEGVKEK